MALQGPTGRRCRRARSQPTHPRCKATRSARACRDARRPCEAQGHPRPAGALRRLRLPSASRESTIPRLVQRRQGSVSHGTGRLGSTSFTAATQPRRLKADGDEMRDTPKKNAVLVSTTRQDRYTAVIAGATALAALMSVTVTWMQLHSSNVAAYEFRRSYGNRVIIFQTEGRKHELRSVTLIGCTTDRGREVLFVDGEIHKLQHDGSVQFFEVDVSQCGDEKSEIIWLKISYEVRFLWFSVDQANVTVSWTASPKIFALVRYQHQQPEDISD